MPITPRFSWSQNENTIEIIIQIHGINKKLLKDFVQITPIFFSLNVSPYLLQIDFENEIDPFHIKVVIMSKKEIKFIFPKKIKKQKWNDLITTKDKEIRLKERKESIDKLYKIQQEIRERRQKEKRLRFKAAQQRQWDEQKYLKHIMNKLENKEKQISENEVNEWVTSRKHIENDEKEEIINDDDNNNKDGLPEIRESNIIEIGFSEWDYVTPIRQNSKPPQFARKTVFNKHQNNNTNISEITPIFLCDKGIKYFMNKDYESAINAFNEAINLDNKYLEPYCNKCQCYIQLYKNKNNNNNNNNIDHLLRDFDKMETIWKSLQCEEMDTNKQNIIKIANIVILLQKGIIQTFILLNKLNELNSKHIMDDQTAIFIENALEKGIKVFEINKKKSNLVNNFGIFKDVEIMENLYKISAKCLNMINIIKIKQFADQFIQNKKYTDAINKYSDAIKLINNNDNDYLLLQYQCLNNRSTAYFLSKQFKECINDCNKIIDSNYNGNNDHKPLIRRGASYLSLWKGDQNNKTYLKQSLNDYQNASHHDKMYELHASKIEKLLTQSV